MDPFCFCCFLLFMLRVFHAFLSVQSAFWSPAGKGLTSWLSCVWCFVTFPCGGPGRVWYLIVSFPDLCLLTYFA